MGRAKWIVGFLGWVAYGPIGALIGFALGAVVDATVDIGKRLPGGDGGTGSASGWSSTTRSFQGREGQRNSFLISLLVLSSAVIKADGRVRQEELDHVKSFIRRNFGEAAVSEAMRMLEGLNRQQVDIYSVGSQIASNMNYSQRLQLFHYLTQIAAADKDFARSEKDVLEAISSAIRLTSSDAASVIAMYYKSTDSAYAVLEIPVSATDDEIKAAYRRMAMKNHPDKVATLGPDVQRAAAEKFRKVQEAYETIKKQRGMA